MASHLVWPMGGGWVREGGNVGSGGLAIDASESDRQIILADWPHCFATRPMWDMHLAGIAPLFPKGRLQTARRS
jgi:hypothetical protein